MTSYVFLVPQNTEHVYGLPSLASLAASNVTNNGTEECSLLANQYIVFADLHIIQAIVSLEENNNTDALDQLSLAQDQLKEAQSQQGC